MKKILVALMSLVLIVLAFAGCDNGGTAEITPEPTAVPTAEPTAEPTATPTVAPTPTPLIPEKLYVGDKFYFGRYVQNSSDFDDKDSILWRVLDVNGHEALVISEYALDCMRFDSIYSSGTKWDNSDIRSWLNSTFYQAAFNSKEKSAILTTELSDCKTRDKLFFLNIEEAKMYFATNEERRCPPSYYTYIKATSSSKYLLNIEEDEDCFWWLRSTDRGKASMVVSSYIHLSGQRVDFDVCVRPAMWITF